MQNVLMLVAGWVPQQFATHFSLTTMAGLLPVTILLFKHLPNSPPAEHADRFDMFCHKKLHCHAARVSGLHALLAMISDLSDSSAAAGRHTPSPRPS